MVSKNNISSGRTNPTQLLGSFVKKPITISPSKSILDARNLLLRYRISRLIVVLNRKAVGIITEKDVARSVSVLSNKSPMKIRVSDAMSKDLITAKITDSISYCAQLMSDNGISSIIITSEDDQLEGIITKTDLVSVFLQYDKAELKVSEIMTKDVVTVSPLDSIFEVQSMLLNHKISRVVVTQKKYPVGIITYRDFVPAKTFPVYEIESQEENESQLYPRLNEFNINKMSYLLTFQAKDIMTKEPYLVSTKDVVYTAAILMIRNQISGLPVTRGKQLAGIITKTDLVKVLAKA